jgi:hypothetical protein
MTSNASGYDAIFQENNITHGQAMMLERERMADQKAFDKFMAKQKKKPRVRYIKAMQKAAK